MSTRSYQDVKYVITGRLPYDHADDVLLPHLLHVKLLSLCALFGLELEEVEDIQWEPETRGTLKE